MNIEQIQTIIDFLPSIVIYVVPGYIFLWVYTFTFSKDIENDKHAIAKSLILSFSLITLFRSLGIEISLSPLIIFVLLITSAISGFLFTKILTSKPVYLLIKKIGINKSFYRDIWNDIVDFRYGQWLRIYLPEERVIYLGKLKRYEETATDKTLIVLSNYASYDYDAEEIDNCIGSPEKIVIINTKDVSRIELYYDKKSIKI